MESKAHKAILVADIGATNARMILKNLEYVILYLIIRR